MKNYLFYSALTVWVVLGVLLVMQGLPRFAIGAHPLRKVDLLGDIRRLEPDILVNDSISLPVVAKPLFVDTCKAGMTCIEDFSDSTYRGMSPFYTALDRVAEGATVRIAYFGDSFIEADILTADLREMLQKYFGGCGPGFVDIASQTNHFRPTLHHDFSGWQSHSASDSVGFDVQKQGIAGRYFVPAAGAYVEMRGTAKYASLLDTCDRATLYYYNTNSDAEISIRINGGKARNYVLPMAHAIQKLPIEATIGSIRCNVIHADSALFYGIALDGKEGIVVDNYSLRGSSGLSLASIPLSTLKQFNTLRPYDLIVLQYGLNVATPKGRDYDYYKRGLLRTIEHLKTAFPKAGILLIGVGDRDYKTEDGELRTMPGIKNLIRYQQSAAAEACVAFWNLYQAMGGEGSMARLASAKPSMANFDYTHINHRGGRHIAKLLYETLVYGKEQFDRRRAYELSE